MTATHSFTLLLEGMDGLQPETVEAIYERVCDDCLLGEREGVVYADFDREAPSFSAALLSAIRDIEGSGLGLRVRGIGPDPLLVNAADIANRTNRTPQSISLYIKGARGPGNFPKPAEWVGTKRALWEWPQVARWFADQLRHPVDEGRESAFIAAMNAALDLRRHSSNLRRHEQEIVAQWVSECIYREWQPMALAATVQQVSLFSGLGAVRQPKERSIAELFAAAVDDATTATSNSPITATSHTGGLSDAVSQLLRCHAPSSWGSYGQGGVASETESTPSKPPASYEVPLSEMPAYLFAPSSAA